MKKRYIFLVFILIWQSQLSAQVVTAEDNSATTMPSVEESEQIEANSNSIQENVSLSDPNKSESTSEIKSNLEPESNFESLPLDLPAPLESKTEENVNSKTNLIPVKQITTKSSLSINKPTMDKPINYLDRWAMSPRAARVYQLEENSWALGASADLMNYEKTTDVKTPRVNQLAMTLHFSYKLNSAFLFNSQWRVANDGPEAHAGGDVQAGSLQIDTAYLEQRLIPHSDALQLRIGNQLIPIGLANVQSELFYEWSVRPPELETLLIPYNWNENGILLVGKTSHFLYHLGVFNSLDGSQFDTTKSSRQFLLDGVQNGQNAKSQDIMFAARFDFASGENLIGGSFIFGDTAQDSSYEKLLLTLGEVHSVINYNDFELRAMWALAMLTESYKLIGPTFFDQASGYYVSLAYDIHRTVKENQTHRWLAFVRFSNYNLHAKVSLMDIADPELDRTRSTLGFNYRIGQNVAYKMNYQWRRNARTPESDYIEFSAHFAF